MIGSPALGPAFRHGNRLTIGDDVRRTAPQGPTWQRLLAVIAITGLVAHSGEAADSTQAEPAQAPRFHRPAAVAVLDGGRRLAVANAGTGSISLLRVDWPDGGGHATPAGAVETEIAVGRSVSDLAVIESTPFLLASDRDAHRLLMLRRTDGGLVVVGSVPVARYPVSVAVAPARRLASVASLWSRTLTLFAIEQPAASPEPVLRDEISLPFPPRLQVVLPDQERVVVADAFGGQLAVINLVSRQVESIRDVRGSNIRGLALSRDGRTLAVSHQITNHLASTTGDDIHWGLLMENVVRLIEMSAILYPGEDLFKRGRLVHLGQPGSGAGDPAGLRQLASGEWLVAIAGVDEAAIVRPEGAFRARIPVGDRPLLAALDESGKRAFIVNELSDSVSVIDLEAAEVTSEIALGPLPEATPASRGERLFYDAGLSHDRWLSCHSCHTDGHSTGQLVDTKSDGTYGTPKRILSLLGTRDANPWAWNGEFRELHAQVRQSILSSMQGRLPSPGEVADLVAFLHTLDPAPPRKLPSTAADEALVARGRDVFHDAGCARCHIPPLTYTSDAVYDVGFEDETGRRTFNPPFLRGVSQRDSLFHDGRAKSLREALTEYGHQLNVPLDEADLSALIEFLDTL